MTNDEGKFSLKIAQTNSNYQLVVEFSVTAKSLKPLHLIKLKLTSALLSSKKMLSYLKDMHLQPEKSTKLDLSYNLSNGLFNLFANGYVNHR